VSVLTAGLDEQAAEMPNTSLPIRRTSEGGRWETPF